MKKEYKMALSEVNQILSHTEEEIISKIPQKFKQFIENNMDKTHQIQIEENASLTEQNIMQETKQILALIYRDYICTQKEREELLKQEHEERKRIEKEQQEKYNIDFEKIKENRQQKNIVEKLESKEETALVEIAEERWYKKIINKILKIFRIKS